MKINIFYIIVIFIASYSGTVFGQLIDPNDLTDPDIWIRLETITIIMDERLEDYIPDVEDAIFQQEEPIMMFTYLRALDILKSPNIVAIALEFIEQADNFENMLPPRNPLEMKVLATDILFNQGEYTTSNYVFEIIDRDKPNVNHITIDLLDKIISNVPSYADSAKLELEYIMNNTSDVYSKFYASFYLNNNYGSEYLSEYLSMFTSDPDVTVRALALKFLFDYEYVGLRNLLLQRMPADPDETMRAQIADSILAVYGEPSDLKAVIEYQPNEPDPDIQTWMEFSINDFIPPRPTIPTSEMITNLIGYTDELYQYGWITEVSVYNQYLDYLKDIEKAHGNEDKELLCANLIDYLSFTEGLHNSPLLTEEGYKFMHYHGIYIKENVEKEFGKCE